MARGSIRKRGQTWKVTVDVGRDPTTRKRRQLSKGGFKTRREANRWLTHTLGQLDQGSYVTPTRQTVGEHLLAWLPAIRSSLRPATYESYERNVRQHLIPTVGHIWLDQLTPDRLAAVYAELHRSGRLTAPAASARVASATSTRSSARPSGTPSARASWPATSPRRRPSAAGSPATPSRR